MSATRAGDRHAEGKVARTYRLPADLAAALPATAEAAGDRDVTALLVRVLRAEVDAHPPRA